MSNTVQMGKASLAFHEPVYIQSAASIVGKKEGEGPLKHCFDTVSYTHLDVYKRQLHSYHVTADISIYDDS